MSSPIENVVFDVGNVLVRWSPPEVIAMTFGEEADNAHLVESVFDHEIWRLLNCGLTTENEAKLAYRDALGFSEEQVDSLFYHSKTTQLPIDGTAELLSRLRSAGYRVFGLTDNLREIVTYLRARHSFWATFDGVVVSADVGCTKPDPAIYLSLLDKYELVAERTVFTDDHPPNVAGAQRVGMTAFQFHDARQCEATLRGYGLRF